VPYRGDTPPLRGEEISGLAWQVTEGNAVEEHHLCRRFRFGNLREALGLVDRAGELAEDQGHHPDFSFG
jgi:4a-hydroxytetrahydrobiopterin dehydratase